jgi:hypothetical protein
MKRAKLPGVVFLVEDMDMMRIESCTELLLEAGVQIWRFMGKDKGPPGY